MWVIRGKIVPAISVIVNDDLDRMVRLYMKASGNKLAEVVRHALEGHVLRETKLNDGVREKYEQLTAEYLASSRVISLVAHRKPRKKAESGNEDGGVVLGDKTL